MYYSIIEVDTFPFCNFAKANVFVSNFSLSFKIKDTRKALIFNLWEKSNKVLEINNFGEKNRWYFVVNSLQKETGNLEVTSRFLPFLNENCDDGSTLKSMGPSLKVSNLSWITFVPGKNKVVKICGQCLVSKATFLQCPLHHLFRYACMNWVQWQIKWYERKIR